MLNDKLKNYEVILASASPRRKLLLEEMDVEFTVFTKNVQEDYPDSFTAPEVAKHLSEIKASAFADNELLPNKLLITADTVVAIGNEILGKPSDEKDAAEMLRKLSAGEHEVITGVCSRTVKIHEKS